MKRVIFSELFQIKVQRHSTGTCLKRNPANPGKEPWRWISLQSPLVQDEHEGHYAPLRCWGHVEFLPMIIFSVKVPPYVKTHSIITLQTTWSNWDNSLKFTTGNDFNTKLSVTSKYVCKNSAEGSSPPAADVSPLPPGQPALVLTSGDGIDNVTSVTFGKRWHYQFGASALASVTLLVLI